jgi:hypothetical protein
MTPGFSQAWKSRMRFPHPQLSYYYEFIFSCQVCWRTMRWHNGRTRRSENPYPEEVLQDCLTNGETSAAHSILARSYCSNEGRIHLRRPTCHSHFSLATRRRTIHSGWHDTTRTDPESLSIAWSNPLNRILCSGHHLCWRTAVLAGPSERRSPGAASESARHGASPRSAPRNMPVCWTALKPLGPPISEKSPQSRFRAYPVGDRKA